MIAPVSIVRLLIVVVLLDVDKIARLPPLFIVKVLPPNAKLLPLAGVRNNFAVS
jgi:hypothetical protein